MEKFQRESALYLWPSLNKSKHLMKSLTGDRSLKKIIYGLKIFHTALGDVVLKIINILITLILTHCIAGQYFHFKSFKTPKKQSFSGVYGGII